MLVARGRLSGLLFLAACGQPTANIYDVCSASEQCPGATNCLPANTTAGGFVGNFCTVGCAVDTDCPEDGSLPPVCETGQCYAGCPNNTGCPYGETCTTGGTVLFCVP
jgi:hypothetical protein